MIFFAKAAWTADRRAQSVSDTRHGTGTRHAQLVVLEAVADLFGDAPQVAEGDLACAVVVEKLERAPDFFHGVACEDAFAHCARDAATKDENGVVRRRVGEQHLKQKHTY